MSMPNSKKPITEMTIEDKVYLEVYCALMVEDRGTYLDPSPDKIWKLTREWVKPILRHINDYVPEGESGTELSTEYHRVVSYPNADVVVGSGSVTVTVAPPPPNDRALKKGVTPAAPSLPPRWIGVKVKFRP